MVSSPTLARRSRIWRSASSRTGFPLSKTSLRCSSACLRQAAIWVGWTPWRDPSSVSVASPRRASRATRALNFEEWFLRERFMVSTPLHWHYRRYDGAVHPLNAARFFVQKSAATSDAHLIDPQPHLRNLRYDLGLEAESILSDLNRLDDIAAKNLVARLHVGQVQIRQHVRKEREKPVPYGVPEVKHSMGTVRYETRSHYDVSLPPDEWLEQSLQVPGVILQ